MESSIETTSTSAPPYPAPAPGIKQEALAEEETFPVAKAINYSVANFGASIFYGLFNFAMPLYLRGYGLPAWLIGLLANERSFVGAFVQPVVGRISDRTRTRFGKRRPFFLVGIPVVCFGLWLLAYHPDLWPMLVIVAVLAFFLSVAWDPYMALMADIFPEKQRGRVGAITNGVATSLGTIAFSLFGIRFWSGNETLVFGLVIVLLILTWGYTFITVKEPPLDKTSPLPEGKAGKPSLRQYFRTIMSYPEASKYTLAITFFWLGTGGVIPFITLFGVKALGAPSESDAFILPLAAVLAGVIAAVPLGMLADRIGKKKVMMGGMFSMGLAAIVGSQTQTMLQAALIMMVLGVGNAAMAMMNPMITDLVPKKRMAEFIGLVSAVFSFAQPVGSVLAGLVVGLGTYYLSEGDGYRWSFIWAGVMLLIGGVLLRRVHPERVVRED